MLLSLNPLTLGIFCLSFSVAKQYTCRKERMLMWAKKVQQLPFPSQRAKHSCSCIGDHGKDAVPSTAYPSLMEAHHLQCFWKKCISWKPLLGLSSFARFCPAMMIKGFSLWKKHSSLGNEVSRGEFGCLTWGSSISGNAWSWRQVTQLQLLVAAMQHLRMGIPVPTHLVVSQGEDPVG